MSVVSNSSARASTNARRIRPRRAYSQLQQRRLVELLHAQGIAGRGGTDDRGAFVVVETPEAARWCAALAGRGIVTDARGRWLRLCPDVLTQDAELVEAAAALGEIAAGASGRRLAR
jgi:kynureninase